MEDSIITASNTAVNDEGVMDVNSSEIVGGSYGIYSKEGSITITGGSVVA